MNRRDFLASVSAFVAPLLTLGGRGWSADVATPDITDLLEQSRKKLDLPALAAAVISENRVLTVGAVGVRKLGERVPVTAHDQFHLGSCTKAMTATVAGMLVQEKKLAWDSTLAGVFPKMAEKIHRDL